MKEIFSEHIFLLANHYLAPLKLIPFISVLGVIACADADIRV